MCHLTSDSGVWNHEGLNFSEVPFPRPSVQASYNDVQCDEALAITSQIWRKYQELSDIFASDNFKESS